MLDLEGLSWGCEDQLEIRHEGWAAEASTETSKVSSLSVTWLTGQGPLSASLQVMQNLRSDWCTRWLCCFLKYLDRLEKWLAELIPNGLHCYQTRTFSSIDRFSCIIEKLSSVKLSLWRLRRKFWLFKMCLQEMEWCLRILLPSALYVLQFHLPSLGICSCVIAFLFFFRRADGIFFFPVCIIKQTHNKLI